MLKNVVTTGWAHSEIIGRICPFLHIFGPIPWGHSGPLCHALSLSSSLASWKSMRRRHATVQWRHLVNWREAARCGEWAQHFLNAFCSQSTNMSKSFSGVTAPNLTKFVHDVTTFNALLSCPSAFWYSYPFRKGSATQKIFLREKRRSWEFNWLPWLRPLSDRQKNAKFLRPLHSSTNPWKVDEDTSSSTWELIAHSRPLKNEKIRKKTSTKYKALPASLPSKLNYCCILIFCRYVF